MRAAGVSAREQSSSRSCSGNVSDAAAEAQPGNSQCPKPLNTNKVLLTYKAFVRKSWVLGKVPLNLRRCGSSCPRHPPAGFSLSSGTFLPSGTGRGRGCPGTPAALSFPTRCGWKCFLGVGTPSDELCEQPCSALRVPGRAGSLWSLLWAGCDGQGLSVAQPLLGAAAVGAESQRQGTRKMAASVPKWFLPGHRL